MKKVIKIKVGKLRKMIKEERMNQLKENKQEDIVKINKFIDELDKEHKGDYRSIHHRLVQYVNSPYGRMSNDYVDQIWVELKKRFPS